MESIEIFFDDLNEEAQKGLCKAWGTTPEDENWEYQPLAILEREDVTESF